MSDITTQEFLEVVSNGLRVPVGNDRFSGNILSAINRAINDINQHADTEIAIVRLGSLNDATIGLDEDYEGLLHDGVQYHLEKMGVSKQAVAPKGGVSIADLLDRFMESIDNYWYQQLLASQSDASNDIAGLGATNY